MKALEAPTTRRSPPHYNNVIVHPAAAIAPALQGEAFDAFCDVMKRYGDVGLDPIVAVRWPEADGHINGTIALLSGQTNFAACKKLGRSPKIEIYSGEQSPAELAVSLQLLHPHLSTDQRAAIGVEIVDQISTAARERQKAAGGDRKSLLVKVPKAIADAAPTDAEAVHSHAWASRIVDVSATYIQRAQAVRDHSPENFAKLKTGAIKLGFAFQETRRDKKRAAMAPLRPELPARGQWLDVVEEGDALKLMTRLPRQKFRLAFTDPRYNQGFDYGNGSAADRWPEDKYLEWCERWITQLAEIVTPDGTVVVLIDQLHLGEFLVRMKRARPRLHMRSVITWYETFGGNCSDNFNRTSRYLLYFVRDPKRCVFNREKLNRPSDRLTKYDDGRANPAGKNLDDVWFDIPRLMGTSTERLPDYKTQLPELLVRRVVEGLSEEGDAVIDPFCGSGTTAAVCAKTGRRYWTCDVVPQAVSGARARVQQIVDMQKQKLAWRERR